jgi:hypothetical protein
MSIGGQKCDGQVQVLCPAERVAHRGSKHKTSGYKADVQVEGVIHRTVFHLRFSSRVANEKLGHRTFFEDRAPSSGRFWNSFRQTPPTV